MCFGLVPVPVRPEPAVAEAEPEPLEQEGGGSMELLRGEPGPFGPGVDVFAGDRSLPARFAFGAQGYIQVGAGGGL